MTEASPRLLAEQLSLPQGMPALPPAREFITSAGFAGALALLAAIIIALVAAFAVRGAVKRHRALVEQQESHNRELRRAEAIQECRERLVWVVDKGSIEPGASDGATVGLGAELALTVLQGIHDEADKLGDATLAKAAAVQIDQFSRVLARQSGALSQLATTTIPAADEAAPGERAASEAGADASATTTREQPSTPARQATIGGRRRRP